MIFLDIFRESPNLLRRKNAIILMNYLVKKMILLVSFLVISFVDHFFGEIICQFLAKKSVKVLLQYLISSIQCEKMNIFKKVSFSLNADTFVKKLFVIHQVAGNDYKQTPTLVRALVWDDVPLAFEALLRHLLLC